jgi:hypothetical protein
MSDGNGFILGLIYAAWWLNRMHHEDSLAVDLLHECGESPTRLRRIARREQYRFSRGFWSSLQRRSR